MSEVDFEVEPEPKEPETIFGWSIFSRRRGNLLSAVGSLLGAALVVPACLYFFLYLVSLLSIGLAYWAGIVLTVLIGLVLLLAILGNWASDELPAKLLMRGTIYYTSLATLGGMVFLLSSPVSHFDDAFQNGANAGFAQWFFYFVDNTFSVILLDVPELFHMRISEIDPRSSGLSRVLTFIVRVLITIGLVSIIWEMFRYRTRKTTFYGTENDCYWECKKLPSTNGMWVRQEAQVVAVEESPEIVVDDFTEAYKPVAEADKEEGEEKKELPPPTDKAEELPVRLDCADRTEYQWTICFAEEDKKASELGGLVILGIIFPVLIYLFFKVLGLVMHSVVFWGVVGLGGIMLLYLLGELKNARSDKLYIKLKAERAIYLTGMFLIGCLLFILDSPRSFLTSGFANGADAGAWQWTLFYADNFLSVIFLDTFDLFDWHMSKVRWSDGTSRFLTLVLRIMITLGAIRIIVYGFTSFKGLTNVFYGTVRACYWHCEALPSTSHLTMAITGKVVPFDAPREHPVETVLELQKDEAEAAYEEQRERERESEEED